MGKQIEDEHRNRVSGISGRTAGRMFRATKANPSSQHNPLRNKRQIQPRSDKDRFPSGKYHAPGTIQVRRSEERPVLNDNGGPVLDKDNKPTFERVEIIDTIELLPDVNPPSEP